MTENSISSEQILENLRKNLSAINATVDKQEASVVIEVGDGIAHVSGLKSAMAGAKRLSRVSSTTPPIMDGSTRSMRYTGTLSCSSAF